eukprot:scaffold155172_cov22-Tisochrysis_lutea.AAC.1
MWERNHSPPRSAQAARGRTSAPTHGVLCKARHYLGVVTAMRDVCGDQWHHMGPHAQHPVQDEHVLCA